MKASGEIQSDPRQAAWSILLYRNLFQRSFLKEVCMKMLDDLAKQIEGYSPKMTRAPKAAAPAQAGRADGIPSFFLEPELNEI